MALTQRNHQLIREHFVGKDTAKLLAVDATCGNGNDTLFLAKLGFNHIFSFDIQTQAINNTKLLVEQQGIENITIINSGHENMNQHITEKVDCILFNLGYLPSANKNVTTTKQTSLAALEQSLDLLTNAGLLSILCYPGHPQGAIETASIQQWLKTLKRQWQVFEILASHPSPKAPVLFLIQHRIN